MKWSTFFLNSFPDLFLSFSFRCSCYTVDLGLYRAARVIDHVGHSLYIGVKNSRNKVN
uniref:Uncharacterized protein n=1 Tax=Daphnia magna TaxID=35525 RepID=A0A0P6G303_9CRUS